MDKKCFSYGVLSGISQASKLKSLFLLFLVVGIIFAQEGVGDKFYNVLNYLCGQMVMLLPVVALSLLVLAAVVYGVGHIFGSETKSKAQSWATGMIIGMLISLIIWLLSKPLITMFLSPDAIPEDFCQPTWGQ
jgi:Na+/proline symporter